MWRKNLLPALLLLIATACTHQNFDTIIQNGTIYNGTGDAPFTADIGMRADTIAAIGDLSSSDAPVIIDAEELAVSPGFINMLSWANYSLLNDGRSMSDIKQGVTLEIFGEGSSMGPLNEEMHQNNERPWTTLGEYLEHLTKEQGISTNVASFVGATTIRQHVIGSQNVSPTAAELRQMQQLVREAMEEGALGVGSSLIYAPAFFASTEELIALAEAAAEYDGTYISHIRSEGDDLLKATDELFTIATEAGIDAQIYHLKAAGKRNWDKLPVVLTKIDSLRSSGHNISANMYTYTAASTGLDATIPPTVQEGSYQDFITRLKQPEIREQVLASMRSSQTDWENFYQLAGAPENILLVGFNEDSLKHFTGKNLAEISEIRNTDPAETIIDLIIENNGDISSVFFVMSEENVRTKIKVPYMSFGSDARSVAAEGEVLESSTHPRTYGTFARLLGKYVRDENVISLEEAIYRLTGLPAKNLKLQKRGYLSEGYFGDIVIFDPATIEDKATFTQPHQYAVGVHHVFVNGVQVLKDGEHTGAMPGQVVRGPGWK
ncbi:MAG: amidohydrolase family protein [Gracilimonas sp.]|uniref:N-acyl-D-amino-acid deacylase family protein n=1 Tax=Gracilimonas sp. TaxID=1974203 RepID=UPI00198A1B78|nr:amidohydrolase family protein [Gracilimonas sp.]MBD3616671.1 amidohydrolase family protein [Gracilimonas sp.]